MSKKRRALLARRAEVRQVVLVRDRVCQAAVFVPEVACGFLPGRPGLEVDELRGGSRRATEWLDPEDCQAICPVHHDWKTDHKKLYLTRRGIPC